MLSSVLLRLVARSSDSLVKFVVGLDAALDKFIAKHDDEVAAAEQRVRDIAADAAAEVERIQAAAADAVQTVENELAEKAKAAKILIGLKGSLPTGG